jgi:lactobin A/cerein 7B family class IIb bacteriocin
MKNQMNLEKMNLVELNAQEAVRLNGGIWPWIGRLIGAAIIDAINDPESFKKGGNDGYNAVRH